MIQRAAVDSCAMRMASCSMRTSPQLLLPVTATWPAPQRQATCRGVTVAPDGVLLASGDHRRTHGALPVRRGDPCSRLRTHIVPGGPASALGDGADVDSAGQGPSSSSTWTPVVTTARPTSNAEPFAWPALEPPFSYYASAEDAQSNAAPSGLSPIWKVLLLSDGSVTRHLQLLSGAPVTAECLSMRNVGWSLEGMPPGTELIPGPRVQRQVLLRCQHAPLVGRPASSSGSNASSNGGGSGGGGSSSSSPAGQPLVYASSWWNADTVDEYLRDKSKPIWMSLSQGHVELYREVHALFRGGSPELESLLGCPGPLWGRQYVFWSGGRPLTLIYEVFSPRLQQYLGPAAEGESGDEAE